MNIFRLHSARSLSATVVVCSLVSVFVAGTSHAATIKVACLGEQTTKTNDASFMMWPLLLGTSLGANYNVVNEGGDTAGTILTGYTGGGDAHPYTMNGTQDQYADSLTADIVVIGPMGEHDERAVANNAALGAEAVYETDLDAMVTAFMHDSHKVVLTTPIQVPSFNQATQTYVTMVVLPATKAVAMKRSVPLVDLYTAFTDQAALFAGIGDGHVNADGEKKIAELVLPAIQTLASGAGGSGGTAGAGGTAGGGGAAGASIGGDGGVGGAGLAGSSGGGAAGASVGGAGGATSAGTGGGPTAGAAGAAATGAAPVIPSSGDDGGGCSVSHRSGSSGFALSLLSALALIGLSRRKRPARR